VAVQTAVHRTLDGRRIVLTGDLDLSQRVTAVARIRSPRFYNEISSTGREGGVRWSTLLFGIEHISEEFSLSGGTLRIGHGQVRDTSLDHLQPNASERLVANVMVALWEGKSHSVFTHFYDATSKDAIEFFDAFSMAEDDDGVSVSPRADRRVEFAEEPILIKPVPPIGLFYVSGLTTRTARRLPRWQGTRLGSGELFRDETAGQPYFVFVTSTAQVTIMPMTPERQQMEEALSHLEGMSVQIAG
jgi:hypothetical protein